MLRRSRARPCSLFLFLSYAVHTRRIVTVEPASVGGAPSAGEPLSEAVPRDVVSHQRQHRPVAGIEYPLRTEALDHPRGVREEILGAPGFPRFGEQSRQLAARVLQRRETGDSLAPGLQGALPDPRLAAMVEHEAGLGTVAHEIDDLAQLIMRRAQIEHQSTSPHGAHAVHEGARPAEAGGLSLDILADAFDPGQRRERIQRLCESRAPSPEPLRDIDEGADAGDARPRLRQALHELYLAPGLSGAAIGFHEHDAIDRDVPR